ncbi:threonine aldolase family protein [Dactylosporangium darangshiense]|uniref:GntG family PLP-dependent aldolase n=1 Tax=Dactylosporangium darangshiense TaxID=579108 RepID=A0ABP8DVC3_9ACTN
MTAHRRAVVDLRSDTVTRPTPGMRAAMAGAEVGDDVYGEDPTTRALEDHVAGLLGHEAGVFLPTGTMANQVAVQALIPHGGELLCADDAHLVSYEAGAAAVHGGITTRTWHSPDGFIDPAAIAAMIRSRGGFALPTDAIAVEQTANLPGGIIHPLDRLTALHTIARRAGVGLHCDGARLWHAHTTTGTPMHVYGRLFDTVCVCLSKGLGAPAGAVLAGPHAFIANARRLRQRAGGAMRQTGMLAAAGLYAIGHHLPRLADNHHHAQLLATALADTAVVDPHRVHTNIVLLDLTTTPWTGPAFTAAAANHRVLLVALGPHHVRAVTHRDLTTNQIRAAAAVLQQLLAARPADTSRPDQPDTAPATRPGESTS